MRHVWVAELVVSAATAKEDHREAPDRAGRDPTKDRLEEATVEDGEGGVTGASQGLRRVEQSSV